ncbi:techylectin-5A-like [Dermacentor silvarum]|uniref:techylectin-5A-like n=1 Tax=Dermacentor silvarum TaxID=543639 RepID=UPI0021014870|nr:techylectin-5A-like [Dermacentor silvarum]
MEPAITILCIIASVTSGVLSMPEALVSYNRLQERMRQLAEDFNALEGSFKPAHCTYILHNGQHTSGVYTVFHKAAGNSGQKVYCDMDTDGGGWTVIQHRGQYGNPVYYFYRNWTEYANGFGNPAEEYWIGNNALHALTSGDEKMVLRIVLSNSTKETVSLDYKNFTVGSEEEYFRLQVGDYTGKKGWNAIGLASGHKFSTFDRDNDGSIGNCAFRFRGGWWYDNCLGGNLNGLNLNGPHDSMGDGIDWNTRETPYHYSYPNVRMMIRPAGKH